jgi:hypothetical protein
MVASNSPLNSNRLDNNSEKGQLAAQSQNPYFDVHWRLCSGSDAESGSGLRNQRSEVQILSGAPLIADSQVAGGGHSWGLT